jgi:hypothetical protein
MMNEFRMCSYKEAGSQGLILVIDLGGPHNVLVKIVSAKCGLSRDLDLGMDGRGDDLL